MQQRDPLGWTFALTAAFLALAAWHLGIPSKLYFDEVHYVPAARRLLALVRANIEHPLVGKAAIAGSIGLLGDRPVAWRLPSLLCGGLGLFAFGRALWWASGRRFTALAGIVLLATDFAWFIQSRIAMLDMVMAGFAMVALWQIAAAMRQRARWRLAVAGVAMGLAMGAKWSVIPAFALLGLGLVAAQARRTARPFPALSLMETAFWLGTLPLCVYWATFLPAAFYHDHPLDMGRIVDWHWQMVALQDSVTQQHPYQSQWYQWAVNWRAIWYLYEPVDGVQRGVVLVGNPATMLLGLPALGWCLWAAAFRGRREAGFAAGLYAVSLGFWAISGKPVQFYYHYLLPGTFLMAALALALDAVWQMRGPARWLAPGVLALSVALFAGFYPIISAAPLHHGVRSFEAWMWLASWR
ncbi:MAG: phospholipid carrier-dependent glycosyltransferase [Sphingomonadales bacterium]|nr:phospholipid carrier-dependent glycosyltransferase [Sphingomonadales bacterium]